MVHHVLAVLDGSPGDAIVHQTTAALVSHCGAKVDVLGLSDPDQATSREAVPAGALHYKQEADARRYRDLKDEIATRVELLAARVREAGGEATAATAEGQAMTELSRRWNGHDLLSLGREKRGQGTRLLSRRGLIRLLRDCPRPVLINSAAQLDNGESIAIAYDGSAEAKTAVRQFLKLGLSNGRRLEVVCVRPDADDARRLADEAERLCADAKVSYEIHQLAADRHPLTVLANKLVALQPALMVAASRGAASWREFVFGSLPARLIRGSGATLYMHP